MLSGQEQEQEQVLMCIVSLVLASDLQSEGTRAGTLSRQLSQIFEFLFASARPGLVAFLKRRSCDSALCKFPTFDRSRTNLIRLYDVAEQTETQTLS